MPSIKNDDTLLIRCSCHCHVLEVTYETYEPTPTFTVSVWNQSPSPINFWDRLKMIWKLLCFKNLEGGDVIIDNNDAENLINFLTKNIGKSKKQKTKPTKNVRQFYANSLGKSLRLKNG
jgi:hypothetical protein